MFSGVDSFLEENQEEMLSNILSRRGFVDEGSLETKGSVGGSVERLRVARNKKKDEGERRVLYGSSLISSVLTVTRVSWVMHPC